MAPATRVPSQFLRARPALLTLSVREKLRCESGRREAGVSIRRQRQHVSGCYPALHVRDLLQPARMGCFVMYCWQAAAGGLQRQPRVACGSARRARVLETPIGGCTPSSL